MKKEKIPVIDTPDAAPRQRLLRMVPTASTYRKPLADRTYVLQRADTGLVIGCIGPILRQGQPAVGFAADGVSYTLSAQALREIADFIDMHGLELAG